MHLTDRFYISFAKETAWKHITFQWLIQFYLSICTFNHSQRKHIILYCNFIFNLKQKKHHFSSSFYDFSIHYTHWEVKLSYLNNSNDKFNRPNIFMVKKEKELVEVRILLREPLNCLLLLLSKFPLLLFQKTFTQTIYRMNKYEETNFE